MSRALEPVADALVPAPFPVLLAWALEGLARERSVFGLPRRSFWQGDPALDLSVRVPGARVATPLGVAAGPHTQLAHNLVVGWLAGARVLELKTVQVLDRLEIARPCIDAPAEGYNVEWSQELRLEQSLEQYVSAWGLIHALAPLALTPERAAAALAATRFDASVGYDLAGVRSGPVARFLDGLTDASGTIARLRASLPAALAASWPEPLPARVVDTVTLSSFHGCPADEIERIVEHLFARHALNVVVKLNPTLLGFDAVEATLHGPLGWSQVVLDRDAFARDLQWDHALALLSRLQTSARRHGRTLGVKLTNTLVVRNTRGRLAGEQVYLSGAPLHPIAMQLAERLARATGGTLPMALSAGVNAENFADAVACGFAPVTTCTDLLHPTGYRRLPRYLKALEAELSRTATRTVDDYVRARAAERGEPCAEPHDAGQTNLRARAATVTGDPRYAAPAAAAAANTRAPLALVDCESCNQCTLACPNGAIFDVATPPASRGISPGAPAGTRERQWVLLAGFCNSCGNCDTFCPQSGGPYLVKARFHTTRAAWERDPGAHAVLVEPGGGRIVTRHAGREVVFEREANAWREIAAEGIAAGPGPAPATSLWLRALVEQALREVNPLSAVVRGG